MPREIEYLMYRYSLDEEAAVELLAELKDTKSLSALANIASARAVVCETHRP